MGKSRRRNKRSTNKVTELLDNNIFIKIVIAMITIILICVVAIVTKNINTKIEIANQRIMLEQKIAAIFEDNDKPQDNDIEQEQPVEVVKKTDTVIKIGVVGDILCSDEIIEDAKQANGTYNFMTMFEGITHYINENNFTIGTMETNFTDNKFSDYIKCNSPKEFARDVKESGIDLITLAHNHALDYGVDGLKTTKSYLEELGFITIGVKTNDEETGYIIKDIKGIKVAFLSYTYGVNSQKSINSDELKYVNIFDKQNAKNDIEKVKEQSDFIFVMMHWGKVNSTNINSEQEEIANFLIENGANIIVGSHPSVIEPMEVKKNSQDENVFIAYSVGNYISYLGYENSDLEMILNIQISKNGETGKVKLDKVTYTPVYMVDNGSKKENRFNLVDMQNVAKEYANGNTQIVTKKIYNKLIKGLEMLEKIIRSRS